MEDAEGRRVSRPFFSPLRDSAVESKGMAISLEKSTVPLKDHSDREEGDEAAGWISGWKRTFKGISEKRRCADEVV